MADFAAFVEFIVAENSFTRNLHRMPPQPLALTSSFNFHMERFAAWSPREVFQYRLKSIYKF